MRLDLGTTLTATLVSAGGAVANGTRLTLRLGAPLGAANLLGQIALGAAAQTLIETEIGTWRSTGASPCRRARRSRSNGSA